MKLFKGFLLSALVTYVLSLVIFVIFSIGNELMLPVMISISIVAPLVIVGALIVWGIPCHLLLKKLGIDSPFFYALAGFFPVPLFLAIFTPFGNEPLAEFLAQCATFGFLGVLAATMLWYFVVYNK